MRWLGFDQVVLFNDSYFMAFMFFVSGLFVRARGEDHGFRISFCTRQFSSSAT